MDISRAKELAYAGGFHECGQNAYTRLEIPHEELDDIARDLLVRLEVHPAYAAEILAHFDEGYLDAYYEHLDS